VLPLVCDNSGTCVDNGACGPILYEGCCDGQTLKYCNNGTVFTQSCTTQPKCGWDASKNYYNCGTSGGSDPSGIYVKKCPY